MTGNGSEHSAAWGVLAGVCVAVVAAIPAWIQVVSARATSVPWIATAVGLSLIALVGLVMCFKSTELGWRLSLPHRRPEPSPPVRGLGQGLGAILASMPPLEMRLEAQEWELWQGWIWIAALKIRMSNHTLDQRTIRLKQFSLNADLGSYLPFPPTPERANAVVQETIRRGGNYTSHIKPMDLEPDDSVSGWYVAWVSMSADGGRPPCTLVATDSAGDTYELLIPARGRRSHHMPGY